MIDEDACYAAIASKDPRFDGSFVTGVTSTHIYCRPSCPALTPRRRNVRFYPTAAAAQAGGFRACKRCRPDASPGSPEWHVRADVVARAMRLISDGVVDRDGVGGLARRLGYSERHLTRLVTEEVGAGPLQLARAQRVQTARLLLESTSMPATQIAFAAGFGSIRQFNDTIRTTLGASPTELRARPQRTPAATAAGISIRLPYRAPFDAAAMLAHLGGRSMPGIEHFDGSTYERVLTLPHAPGTVTLTPADGAIACTLLLGDVRDMAAAVQRCRRMLDLDADPVAILERLGGDPIIGPLVTANPGVRVPGSPDGTESAVRAIISQQVSVAGARTIASRLAERYGTPLPFTHPTLIRAFPTAAALAESGSADLPMPSGRADALRGLCRAIADGQVVLDAGADREQTTRDLLALKGIGPWTAAAVRMGALGDPDVFLAADLGVRKALERLGVPGGPRDAEALSQAWRPWRSYANRHLWNTLGSIPSPRKIPPPRPAPSPRKDSR